VSYNSHSPVASSLLCLLIDTTAGLVKQSLIIFTNVSHNFS